MTDSHNCRLCSCESFHQSPYKDIVQAVRDQGWYIEDGVYNEVSCCFSVGLYHSFSHPEVIVLGHEDNRMVIESICKMVEGGRAFDAGLEYQDVFQGPTKAVFRTTEVEEYIFTWFWALWFYKLRHFPAFQVFWSDSDGEYPWSAADNDRSSRAQPMLFP